VEAFDYLGIFSPILGLFEEMHISPSSSLRCKHQCLDALILDNDVSKFVVFMVDAFGHCKIKPGTLPWIYSPRNKSLGWMGVPCLKLCGERVVISRDHKSSLV
jgi:hypothetical protein